MKRSEVILFVNAFQRLILKGRIREAAEYCARPLVLYYPETVIVVKKKADLDARLARRHLHYRSSGTQRVEATEMDIQDCTEHRAFVSLKLARFLDDGTTLISKPRNYVLRRSDTIASLVVELADISEPYRPTSTQDPSRDFIGKSKIY